MSAYLFFNAITILLIITNHDSFRVLFDKIASVGLFFYSLYFISVGLYFISKIYIYISALETVSSYGTSTVPRVSAHFCSLRHLTDDDFLIRMLYKDLY